MQKLAKLLNGDFRLVVLYQLVVLFYLKNNSFQEIDRQQEYLVLLLKTFLIDKHGFKEGIQIFSKLLVVIGDLHHLTELMMS